MGGKSASTTIDLATIFGGDINDGSTLTIGEKTYTFKWGDSCPRRLGRNPEPSGPPRRVLVDKDLRPAYYDDFRCLAEDCKISCCKGWNITFSKKDYLSLKRQEGSPDLNARMDTGLRRIRKGRLADQFYGEFNMDSGVCPLLREDGLCQLQREKEHEALPRVCRTYPRADSYLISGCLIPSFPSYTFSMLSGTGASIFCKTGGFPSPSASGSWALASKNWEKPALTTGWNGPPSCPTR